MVLDEVNKLIKLANEVLVVGRNTLIINLRFMDKAISMLEMHEHLSVKTVAVDGISIYYNPVYILKSFTKERQLVPRMYLHMLLHCVYQHFWISHTVHQDYWDLACDIAVENTINDIELDSITIKLCEQQKAEISKLQSKVKYITADMLYRHFIDEPIDKKEYERLSKLFAVDSHKHWYEIPELNPEGNIASSDSARDGVSSRDKASNHKTTIPTPDAEQNNSSNDIAKSALADEWKSIAKQMKMDLDTFSKEKGDTAGGLSQNLMAVTREKYNYESFLKKFAVLGERMKINDDEFDYIFYTYGLNLYGKMPLIEPLEYKDVKQIKEFVIAIDTSGSTSGDLVQAFVKKTYNILKQEESFFTRFNLHIIQCDAEIQEAIKITCQQEFDNYIANMTIKGMGGTDFRPVFAYVDELISKKEFINLKGMIYFTDGYGTFPTKQPAYDVAVVYIEEGYENPDVPVWAIKLILHPDDIRRSEN